MQIDLFGNEVEAALKRKNNAKRNWENAFQRWIADKLLNEATTPYGKCGYGSMCDYCKNIDKGRPCLIALNSMCRAEHISIDYENRNFEDIWNGDFRSDKWNI